MKALFASRAVPRIVGAAWSLRVAVLFDWVVEATLPAAS